MSKNNLQWMNYSIDIANNTNDLNLHVGAVLVSSENKLICSSFTDENKSWVTKLLSKLRVSNIKNAHSLYLTVNTLGLNENFDINALLKEISVDNIYFGLPDPNLTCYLSHDPILNFKHVCRYPEHLQKQILEQNYKYFSNSKQNIKFNPYYSTKRISNLVIDKLKERGFVISKSELDSNKQIDELTTFIANKYGLKSQDASNLVNTVMSESFDEKYSSYNYSDDARSLNIDWKENFVSVYNKVITSPIDNRKVLDVGVGSGNEAIALFSSCKNITFVDIAKNGLKKIKEQIPNSSVVLSRAENLSFLSNNSYDLYVSLRTYNSSFFDIKQAISEAHRVLKHDAIIIISIANGFLCPEQKCIIPGLLIPGTEFVDIYRGFNMIKDLSVEFLKEGFESIQIFPTNAEIYISAIAK